MDNAKFQQLLVACHEVAALYEPDIVFIGGIAVYLHAANHERTRGYAEMTADADFYISMSALSDLRDIEEVVQNTRLSKHEFQKAGFSFDVYAERQSSLPVPYADVIAHAVRYEGVAVAPLEYLGMPLAILWGVLVFWQWPEPSSWLGMALICGAGLFTIGQEQSDKKARHET